MLPSTSRIRHADDAVVAQLALVEIVVDAAAERGDHALDLLVFEHAVEPRLFDVQDLAAQGQDRLEPPVAPLLCRAARRVALDEVDLAQLRALFAAISELAGERCALEDAFLRVSSRALRAASRAFCAVIQRRTSSRACEGFSSR